MIFTVSEIDILIYQQHQKPNLHVPSFKDEVYTLTADRSFFGVIFKELLCKREDVDFQ